MGKENFDQVTNTRKFYNCSTCHSKKNPLLELELKSDLQYYKIFKKRFNNQLENTSFVFFGLKKGPMENFDLSYKYA